MSGTELLVIAVLALVLLGPKRLPPLARSLGKAMREFRRATNEIRASVEGEFYRMDHPAAPSPAETVPRVVAVDPAPAPVEPAIDEAPRA